MRVNTKSNYEFDLGFEARHSLGNCMVSQILNYRELRGLCAIILFLKDDFQKFPSTETFFPASSNLKIGLSVLELLVDRVQCKKCESVVRYTVNKENFREMTGISRNRLSRFRL